MKQKDIAVVVVIAIISGVLSIFISKAIIVPPKNRQQKVEVIGAISSDLPQPDSKYFNAQSIDPTQLITIGTNNNPQPFSNGTNNTNGH
jgi:hypothetical protein